MKNKFKNRKLIRVLAGIVMFCCIMWGYWWLTWCFAIALLFYFPVYFEIILWGVIYDAMYGIPLPEFWNIRYVFTIAGLVLFLISLFLRKRLIIYEDRA